MSKNIPDYCQVIKVTAPDGSIKELIFPKALDLNRPKRPRTTFSDEQLKILKKEFDENPYLIGKERQKLAKQLHLTETQVKVWFQNRRTKNKKSSKNIDLSSTLSNNDKLIINNKTINNQNLQNEYLKNEKTNKDTVIVPTSSTAQYFPFCLTSNGWQFYSNNCCF